MVVIRGTQPLNSGHMARVLCETAHLSPGQLISRTYTNESAHRQTHGHEIVHPPQAQSRVRGSHSPVAGMGREIETRWVPRGRRAGSPALDIDRASSGP